MRAQLLRLKHPFHTHVLSHVMIRRTGMNSSVYDFCLPSKAPPEYNSAVNSTSLPVPEAFPFSPATFEFSPWVFLANLKQVLPNFVPMFVRPRSLL